MKSNIHERGIFYIIIYSHRDYFFSIIYNKNNEISKPKCINIKKLENYRLYGYGIPKDMKIEYQEVIPDSEKIGLLSIEKFNLFKDKKIDDINPLYLMVQK